jgi:RimJ/RimL family protein N-acetyltransferase
MGSGSAEPRPTACITLDDRVVGWVDWETGHAWLGAGEVNVGYNVFAEHRGAGYATRAVMLLLHRLAIEGEYRSASVLIDRDNVESHGVAVRAGFVDRGAGDNNRYLVRLVPPLTYDDGVVSIRCQEAADLDADLAAKDEAQIRWMWRPGERERWEAMTAAEKREHSRLGLAKNRDSFGRGPKWTFAVDAGASCCVAYVDCDLANPRVPAGEANVSYSCHPEHRGKGYVSRAVRLILHFLVEHTGVRRAHLCIERENVASLRVARAVATVEPEPFVNEERRAALRFVVEL